MTDPPAVEISDLWFSYEERSVLRDVSLRVAPGERVCMVGPNGGGKTTLLKLFLGLLTPTRGTVRVLGTSPEHARPRVGYTPQHAGFDPRFPVSALDVTLMGALGRSGLLGPHRRADVRLAEEALDRVGMGKFARQAFSELSGGQRQRVLIARALVSRPDLLLLDEPTANLDVGVEMEFLDLLRRLGEGLTIVMVSHDIGFVSQAFTKAVCVYGKVAVHPMADLTGELISELYGQDLKLVRHDHDCLRDHKSLSE